jgi:microcystin-dependent protein
MDQYLGEIRVFGFGIIPKGWLACNGQILPVQQNQALFSLLGTTYGGNGTTTFQLPNLQSATMLGQGTTVPGYPMGLKAGTENVTLTAATLPTHNHNIMAQTVDGAFSLNPGAPYEVLAVPIIQGQPAENINMYNSAATNLTPLHPGTMSAAGGSSPHNNMPPFLTVNVCISTTGIYPSRN